MVLDRIAELVGELVVPGEPTALRQAFGVLDQLQARIALGVAELDAVGAYLDEGAVTTAAWLRGLAGRDRVSARKVTVKGNRLSRWPVLTAAVLDGSLTGGQLDIVLAHVPARHVNLFAEHEAELVPLLVGLDCAATEQAMQHWRRHADAVDDGGPPAEYDNEVRLAPSLNGGADLRGHLDADLHALAAAALRVASPKDGANTVAQNQAIGLAQIFQHFLDHQHDHPGARHRPHVSVVFDWDAFIDGIPTGHYLQTGQPLTPAALEALLCDSVLHWLTWNAETARLDYGRASRQWPADLAEAISLRDGGCRFPHCDAPASWCDIHHIDHWENGGPTSIDNGALLCRRHHRMVHAQHLEAKLRPDGTLAVTWPDGRHTESHPRGPHDPTLWQHPTRTADGS